MDVLEYLDNKKEIQNSILEYLEDKSDTENDFMSFIPSINAEKISCNKHDLRMFLNLIVKISNNFHRTPNFFNKINRIIQYFKPQIINYYSNSEIFAIFKSNKRLLLISTEEKMLKIDEYIAKKMANIKYVKRKYPQYFAAEIKPFISTYHNCKDCNDLINELSKELPEDFFEKRRIGENESYLCQLIRDDKIDEFIPYVNQRNLSFSNTICQSVYETNSFLLKKDEVKLIEYATFYGSIQIFQFIQMNGIELEPSIWPYAIHGKNPELIHLIEKEHFEREKDVLNGNIEESIKCHHNQIADYFIQFLGNDQEFLNNRKSKILKNYNFAFIMDEYICNQSFPDLCKYNYYTLVDYLLQKGDININGVGNDGKTALFASVEKENIEIIKLLFMNNKLNVNFVNTYNSFNNVYRKTALYAAVENENIEIVDILSKNANVYVNIECGYKWLKKTAIYLAIERNNIEIFKSLYINKNIWVNKLNIDNECKKTMLCLAVEKDAIEIIKLLLENENIDVNILNEFADNYKKTALHIAVEKGNPEIVELLLNNEKIDTNILYKCIVKDNHICTYEKTALHIAVEKGNPEIVELLLNNEKIDTNILYKCIDKDNHKCTYEKTALYMAVERGNTKMVELLLSNSETDVNIFYKYRYIPGDRREDDYYRWEDRYIENKRFDDEFRAMIQKYLPYHYDEIKYIEKTALFLAIEQNMTKIVGQYKKKFKMMSLFHIFYLYRLFGHIFNLYRLFGRFFSQNKN